VVPLATNGRYPSQAFRAGAAAWGFQFHIEVTPPAVEGLVRAFPDDAARADGGAEAVLAGTAAALAALAMPRDLVFDRFAALVDPAAAHGSPDRFAQVSDS
jgi:GMP synthase (glutamine-hydrolysing)